MSEHLSVYMKQHHHASPRANDRSARPLSSWLHLFLRALVILASLGLMLGRLFPFLLFRSIDVANLMRMNDLSYWVIALYRLLFHVVFIVSEMESKEPYLLPPDWFQKGFLFSFVGLLDMVESGDDTASELVVTFRQNDLSSRVKFAKLLGFVVYLSSRLLVAAGVLYITVAVTTCCSSNDRKNGTRRR